MFYFYTLPLRSDSWSLGETEAQPTQAPGVSQRARGGVIVSRAAVPGRWEGEAVCSGSDLGYVFRPKWASYCLATHPPQVAPAKVMGLTFPLPEAEPPRLRVACFLLIASACLGWTDCESLRAS